MKEQKKKDYKVPSLTVVDFKMERGYAFSSLGATRESYGNNDHQGDGGTSNNNQSWF